MEKLYQLRIWSMNFHLVGSLLAVSSARRTARSVNALGSASASSGPTGWRSGPPKLVDGATQQLDGGYDMFVDEKRATAWCLLFLY